MTRLHLTVEGQTEQVFAANVLIPHLAATGVYLSKSQLAAHARKKRTAHRGGVLAYSPFKNDICRRLREDQSPDVRFSMMVDLYGLPRDFPAFAEAAKENDPYTRVAKLESALRDDIGDTRFIPYIQLHEFEALLLSNPRRFGSYFIDSDRQIMALERLCEQYDTPEKINDGEQTAPSKRIGVQIPEYLARKPTAGPIIAAHIGLAAIRDKCPHFNSWLTRLEQLGEAQCASRM